MEYKFRQDEKVKINIKKPLVFQITDWRSFDHKISYDNDDYVKGGYNKEFRAQLFGVTAKGRSVSLILRGFRPHFYFKIPTDWNSTKVDHVIGTLKKRVSEWEAESLISYKIVKRKKFRGFTNNEFFPFVKVEFKSISGFYKYRKELEDYIDVGGKRIRLPLYESNLEPIMRLIHITDIEPANWIMVNKYRLPDETCSTCQIDIEAHFTNIKKCIREGIAPMITASYDIESDSSHGDFPQARKGYTKLATDIINHYQKAKTTILKLQKTKSNPEKLDKITKQISDKKKYFTSLIKAGFDIKSPLRDEDINYVYTKNNSKVYDNEIEMIIDEVVKICDHPLVSIRGDRKLKEAVQKVINKWSKDKDPQSKKKNVYLKKNIFQLENIIAKTATKLGIDHNTLYQKTFTKDVLITLLTNLFNKNFPAVEGDPVVQIATVVYVYGQPEISYKHIVTLKSCDPIEGVEVVSFEEERDVLLEWARFINRLDPDIMTGYNIFGFDYSFLYYRAQECGCLSEFSKISRLEGYEAPLITKELSSAALGDNTMHYIDMIGRVQIDLLKVIQSGHNLGSYKLDSVAEHFISGKIVGIDKKDPHWIKIKNANEIEVGNYVIITQKKDSKKFAHGDKIKVLDKKTITKTKEKDGEVIEVKEDWIQLQIPFDEKVLSKNPVWGLGKDDVNYKEIFRLQKHGGSEGRRTIAVYCVQDCVLCIRIIRKLEIIANNIGMANVSIVPFSYIFLRGQGVKIFSLVAKECRDNKFLIPVLRKIEAEEKESKEDQIMKLLNNLDDDENSDSLGNLRRGFGDNSDYQFGSQDKIGENTVVDDDDGYEGAIVLPPTPGIYLEEPISVLDYGSLYPSSMISENLSHDSIILDEKYNNLPGYTYLDVVYDIKKWIDPDKKSLGKETVGQKTCRFVQFPDDENGNPVKGIIPMILQKLLAARKVYKKKKAKEKDPFKASVWDGLQLAYKVTANSLYGQIGAKTSPIYLKDVAASTTATGRRLLTLARDFVEANFKNSQVIYGDTDSIFIKYELLDDNGNKLTGIDALAKSIELGIQSEKLIQKYLRPPHILEYEKTFWPFILFTKKRYVGNLYETDINDYVQKSMGIVLKRRDNAPIVKYVFGGIIDTILNEKSIKLSIDFLKKSLQELIEGKFDLQMLEISKTLRGYYKDPESIAHKVLADRMAERDPGNKPQSNDRIPYIYINVKKTSPNEKILQGDKIEHTNYVREKKLEPDYLIYLQNQIMKPVSQIYELIVTQLEKFNKTSDYFNVLEKSLIEKNPDKKYEYIKNKVQEAKQKEIKRILFDEFIRKATNMKYNFNEITDWLVNTDSNSKNNQDIVINKKVNIKQKPPKLSNHSQLSIDSWLS